MFLPAFVVQDIPVVVEQVEPLVAVVGIPVVEVVGTLVAVDKVIEGMVVHKREQLVVDKRFACVLPL
jgi:hypothetical protein